ncbi:MAG: class D sortase [Thermoanaerobaculales bacterium]|jgi:sortase A|nr:class D sortase [Thermoanaerobaculales bacterium]
MSTRRSFLRGLQWALIATGVVLLGYWAGMRLHGWVGGSSAVASFEQVRDRNLPLELPVDTTLWAEDRIAEFEESLDHDFEPPLAVLRIAKIDLEVAVLAGTSELALNRGVGHIDGTPLPGEAGNVGIAGHRDGYFRGLKDIAVGDEIEVETLTGIERFAITDLTIVEPTDVWVLEPTEIPSITLVTCYPFYFVGSAPQRFIVRAEIVSRGP